MKKVLIGLLIMVGLLVGLTRIGIGNWAFFSDPEVSQENIFQVGTWDNPPTVSITSPSDGAIVSGLLTIEASASDDVGVAQVDFYIGATQIGTDTTSPYSTQWDTTGVANETYTLTAFATDTAFQTTSDAISLIVDN